jgi:hypothetical protein
MGLFRAKRLSWLPKQFPIGEATLLRSLASRDRQVASQQLEITLALAPLCASML